MFGDQFDGGEPTGRRDGAGRRRYNHSMTDATALNGRDTGGRFAAGNGFARGNPINRRVAALRSTLINAVDDDDLAAIVRSVVAQAKQGNLAAVKLLFDYTIGKPVTVIDDDDDSPDLPPKVG